MTYYPPISPYAAGLGGKCPRCGQGDLFETFLGLKPACSACGLDYKKADAGDGPAVFIIFIVGFIGVIVAFVMRFVMEFSIAASFVVSASVSVLCILALLRPLKGTLIALQFQHKAHESRGDEAI